MKTRIIPRIIIDLLLALAVLQGWWFIAIPVGIIGCFFFPYFIEIVLVGIAYDSLFGMGQGMGWRGYSGTIISIVILILGFSIKKILKR